MNVLNLIKSYGWSELSGSEGCACGSCEISGVSMESFCHRSGSCNIHDYACIHVWKESGIANKKALKAIAKEIQKEISTGYMCQCDISLKEIL